MIYLSVWFLNLFPFEILLSLSLSYQLLLFENLIKISPFIQLLAPVHTSVNFFLVALLFWLEMEHSGIPTVLAFCFRKDMMEKREKNIYKN